MSEAKMFWLVWCPSGPKPPSARHFAQPDALREAERLAALHPNQEFFVLEAISVSQHTRVVTRRLEMEIPF